MPPSSNRFNYRKLDQRIQSLVDDPLVHKPSLGSYRVYCLPCGERLRLDRRRGHPFYAFNWRKHRSKCPKAVKAQRAIDAGEEFEIADSWKAWKRSEMSDDDLREDEADMASKRWLYAARWNTKSVEIGLITAVLDEEKTDTGLKGIDSADSLTLQELDVARFLTRHGLDTLAEAAMIHPSRQQKIYEKHKFGMLKND